MPFQGGKPAAGPKPVTGRSGTTLVEMLVVITLLGVIAAISYPSLAAAWRRNQVSSAALELQSALTRARSLSVARADGKIYGLVFWPDGRYRIDAFPPGIPASPGGGVPYGEIQAFSDGIRLLNFVGHTPPPLLLVFRDDGIPTADGISFPAPDSLLDLRLESDTTNFGVTVTVSRAAGTARVK